MTEVNKNQIIAISGNSKAFKKKDILIEMSKQLQYLSDLKKKQEEHLRKVNQINKTPWQPCMHDNCPQCHGTGIKLNGSGCVHAMSCGCPKCSTK